MKKVIIGLKWLVTAKMVDSVWFDIKVLLEITMSDYCCLDDGTSIMTSPATLIETAYFLVLCHALRIPGYRLALITLGLLGGLVYLDINILSEPCPVGYILCGGTFLVFDVYKYLCAIMLLLGLFDKYVQKLISFVRLWRWFAVCLFAFALWAKFDSYNAPLNAFGSVTKFALAVLIGGEIVNLVKKFKAKRKQAGDI